MERKKVLELDKICRVCIAERKDMRPLFSEKIAEMLMECATVNIENTEGWPDKICVQCVHAVSRCHAFKKQVERSDKELREYIKSLTVRVVIEETNDMKLDASPPKMLSQKPPKLQLIQPQAQFQLQTQQNQLQLQQQQIILQPQQQQQQQPQQQQQHQPQNQQLQQVQHLQLQQQQQPSKRKAVSTSRKSQRQSKKSHLLPQQVQQQQHQQQHHYHGNANTNANIDNNYDDNVANIGGLDDDGIAGDGSKTGGGDDDDDAKVAYVVEGRNYRKYRVEEKTDDGFIVGEYGVVDHNDGNLRGVRYTADSTINRSLIQKALLTFLKLK